MICLAVASVDATNFHLNFCQNIEACLEVSGSGGFGCNRLLRFVVGFMMILLSAAARIGFDRLIRFEIGLVASLARLLSSRHLFVGSGSLQTFHRRRRRHCHRFCFSLRAGLQCCRGFVRVEVIPQSSKEWFVRGWVKFPPALA